MERYGVDKLAEHVGRQLAGQVHEFRLLLRHNGLVNAVRSALAASRYGGCTLLC
jgi:hypothetical protein